MCFILALRGLSSPTSSQRGNRFGMIGMTIAVVTTLVTHVPTVADPDGIAAASSTASTCRPATIAEILAAIAIGAAIGIVTARRIAMTAMPQLVAAFHSLVGLAAVLVAARRLSQPAARSASPRRRRRRSITQSAGSRWGSASRSARSPSRARSSPSSSSTATWAASRSCCPGGTSSISACSPAILGLIGYFTQDQSPWIFWTITGLSFAIGFLLIIPIGGADMPVVVSMLNSYSGWAAAAMGFTLHNTAMIITGALVGSRRARSSATSCAGR